MAETKIQNFQNHARLDPLFHFFMIPVAVATVIIGLYQLTQRQTFTNVWFVVVAIALLVGFLKIRTYALKAQDRIIRLEERMRISSVLPENEKAIVYELTEGQLVALRFASEDELPELVAKTKTNEWTPKQIKGAIVNWRPDHFRI